MLGTLEDRLLRNLVRGEPDECWEWDGNVQTHGYGQFSFNGKMIVAHRAAWTVWVDDIPEGAFLCHHCDNRRCCNPAHLYVGDAQTNADDAVRRGRSTAGERHPRRKLSAQQVADIRRRYGTGGVYQRELADEYGVSTHQVWRITRGLQWKARG